MATPDALIHDSLTRDWLVGVSRDRFRAAFHDRAAQLTQMDCFQRILLAEPDPVDFLAGLLSAIAAGHHVILGNPRWEQREWQQALAVTRPTLIWGNSLPSAEPLFLSDQPDASPQIPNAERQSPKFLIPTGGSSGTLRFACHTWETLTASVQGFHQFFGGDRLHSCCVLPLFHVSGLMQVTRVLHTKASLALPNFKCLEQGQFPESDMTDWFLSLVPTQLHRLLQNPATVPWLRQFRAILLGGAPAWGELLEQGRTLGLPLAPTYGMTETAAQIATQYPQDFLAGRSGYTVLPHAQVTLTSTDAASSSMELTAAKSFTKPSVLSIQASSLCLGYEPEGENEGTRGDRLFLTDDIGYLDPAGKLHLLGRASDKIITGGENVFPTEVENAIWATGLVQDVAVIGMGDRHWGECVTALYVPRSPDITATDIAERLATTLSNYKRPKRWLACIQLPRNAQGKLNRADLHHLAQTLLQTEHSEKFRINT
ncbi:MAG: AMP-binding protein [Cyanobacteria bacterium J06638_22]